MYSIALKMLIGDRGKYLGIIIGAHLRLPAHHPAVVHLHRAHDPHLRRHYRSFPTRHLGHGSKVQFIDDVKPLQDNGTLPRPGRRGGGVGGPLYKGLLKARLEDGNFQICNVYGFG